MRVLSTPQRTLNETFSERMIMSLDSPGLDPLVSVVIPLHNAGRDVSSLTAQLLAVVSTVVEVVLVDDGSTDNTRTRLVELAAIVPSVRILTGPGRGVAQARNFALAHARGEYVWFADSDDAWHPHVLEVLLARARETGVDVVVCNAQKVDAATGSKLGIIKDAPIAERIDSTEALRRVLTGRLQGHLWNKLVRRSVLGHDPFPATRAHSDLGGVLGILARADGVAMVPETLYSYRIRAGSILNSRAYRWDDLTDCRGIAMSAAKRVGIADSDPALRIFTCTQVVLPIVHESIRRRGVVPQDDLRAVRERIRHLAHLGDVVLLIKAGYGAAATRLLCILTWPGAYAFAYMRYRRRRWPRLDRFVTPETTNSTAAAKPIAQPGRLPS